MFMLYERSGVSWQTTQEANRLHGYANSSPTFLQHELKKIQFLIAGYDHIYH